MLSKFAQAAKTLATKTLTKEVTKSIRPFISTAGNNIPYTHKKEIAEIIGREVENLNKQPSAVSNPLFSNPNKVSNLFKEDSFNTQNTLMFRQFSSKKDRRKKFFEINNLKGNLGLKDILNIKDISKINKLTSQVNTHRNNNLDKNIFEFKDYVNHLSNLESKVENLDEHVKKMGEFLHVITEEIDFLKDANKKTTIEKLLNLARESNEQLATITKDTKTKKFDITFGRFINLVSFLSAVAGVLFFAYQEKETWEKDAIQKKKEAQQIDNQIKKLQADLDIMKKRGSDLTESVGLCKQQLMDKQKEKQNSFLGKFYIDNTILILKKEIDDKESDIKFIETGITELEKIIQQQLDFRKEHYRGINEKEDTQVDGEQFEEQMKLTSNRPF